MRGIRAGEEVKAVEEVAALQALDQLIRRGRSRSEEGGEGERANAQKEGRRRHGGRNKQGTNNISR